MSATITRPGATTAVTPDLVMPFEASDEAGTVVHPIAGRGNPDVTLAEASLSAGKLRLFFLTHEAAEAARQYHRAAAAFTLTAPDMPWLPAYYVVNGAIGRAQQERNTLRWVIEVPFQEVQP